MAKLRPDQILGPPKKITRETLRENPLLAALARQRAMEIRRLRKSMQEPRPSAKEGGS